MRDAHAQLQAYANQAEELAVTNERTRLARDLHDSVTQTLYGLTLQAETVIEVLKLLEDEDIALGAEVL